MGKKLDAYPTEEEEVLILLERVTEANKMAIMVCSIGLFVLIVQIAN